MYVYLFREDICKKNKYPRHRLDIDLTVHSQLWPDDNKNKTRKIERYRRRGEKSYLNLKILGIITHKYTSKYVSIVHTYVRIYVCTGPHHTTPHL